MTLQIIPFSDLAGADLVVDAVYEGGVAGNTGDDPLSKLMRCGNQGGFRKVGRPITRYVVLYSSLEDRDWPDELDLTSGLFAYYGDNKSSGQQIHDTGPGGNELLRAVFGYIHDTPARRDEVPPFFVFTKYPTTSKRSVQFRGLAVPGGIGIAATDDLVAVWKSTKGLRFQNYRAVFTILDVPVVTRAWLSDVFAGNPLTANAPKAWHHWVKKGSYDALRAQPTLQYRTLEEQAPRSALEEEIIFTIYNYFKDNPTGFEQCAASLASMMDDHIIIDEVTRAYTGWWPGCDWQISSWTLK